MQNQNLSWDFSGHTVIVSAGARGIGRSAVCHFAKAGANVLFGDIDVLGAEETLRLNQPHADRIEFVECDFSDTTAWATIKHRIDQRNWTPTILVANVGIGMHQRLEDMDFADFEKVQRVNVTSGLIGAKTLLPYFKGNASGSIIFLSSTMTRCIFPDYTGYTISKSAILGMTRSLAVELASEKIRVNCVLPGFVATGHLRERIPKELWDAFDEEFAPLFDPIFSKFQPLPNCIRPNHIADSILFLASSAAQNITGSELVVDGGLWLQSSVSKQELRSMSLSTPEIEAWIAKHTVDQLH